MVIIVVVGLIDDTMGLQPRLKLLGQAVAALSAIMISDINIDFLGGVLGSQFDLGMLSVPLTLVWIVGITNAINLSDGLDGLASGISLIAFASFGFLAYQRNDMALFAVCLALIGSVLGFLKYNTHPAEIFMGDTGSLFPGVQLRHAFLGREFQIIDCHDSDHPQFSYYSCPSQICCGPLSVASKKAGARSAPIKCIFIIVC